MMPLTSSSTLEVEEKQEVRGSCKPLPAVLLKFSRLCEIQI